MRVRRATAAVLYRKLLLSARERNVSSVDGVVNVSDGSVDDRRRRDPL